MYRQQLQNAIRDGKAVSDLAIQHGVSPSAIYLALRRAGTPVSSLRPHSRTHDWRNIPGLPGYRVTSAGVVQSCVSPRTGALTDYWRDLHAQVDKRGHVYVQIGASGGNRRRLSIRRLILAAWGEDLGQPIVTRVLRRLLPTHQQGSDGH